MHVRLIGGRNRQPHRLGAGRQQQAVVTEARPVGAPHLALLRIDGDDLGLEPQIDLAVAVEILRAQRHPVFRRAAGEIILGQIGPVDRRRRVVADHRDAAAEAVATQHLSRGEARGTAADDDDGLRRRALVVKGAALAARACR